MLRIRVIDWLSRKHAWRYYRAYCESQWYSPAQMFELRLRKLRRLLEHCARHVPFYQDVMRDKGIDPRRIRSLDALELFPIIDKATVQARHDHFVARTRVGMGPIRVSQTGGTTGEPLRVIKDVGVRSSTQAAIYRFYDWMGVGLGDSKLLVWGAPIVRPHWRRSVREEVLRFLTNTTVLDAFRLPATPVSELNRLVRSRHPLLLQGYCLAIYELALRLKAAGGAFALRAVTTTVEPLFDEYRAIFREVFGCETFDQYGCGEVEAIAMECPAHLGLHVTEERVVLELDSEQRVIVTDLDNYAFPLLRYRNGDVAVPGEQGCSCGRNSQKLLRILGRTGDVIRGVNGNRVHPEFFTHLINETGIAYRRSLRRYQVVQHADGRVVWKLESEALDERERALLVGKVRDYLGPIKIDLEVVQEIPLSRSGKFQYVISKS